MESCQTITVVLHPYGEEVSEEDHAQAWVDLRKRPEGRVAIAWMHQVLGEEMSKTCPFVEADKRSGWLAAHDARKSVLLELCAVAVGNVAQEMRVEERTAPS